MEWKILVRSFPASLTARTIPLGRQNFPPKFPLKPFSGDKLSKLLIKSQDTLEYQLCMPTARLFLARLLKAAQVDADAIHLCHFLAEMGLLDYKTSVSFRPSEIAASCLLLTSMLLPRADWGWSRTVEALSGGYRPGNLRECANSLFRAVQSSFQRPGQLPAIREKYAVQAYNGISKAVEPQLQRMQVRT